MENSAGNVWHRYRDIEIVYKQSQVGSTGTNVFIIYVCLLPSDINHARLMEPMSNLYMFMYVYQQLQPVSFEIGKWPKLPAVRSYAW